MVFKQFPWVPDGIYDSRYYLVRYKIVDGNARHVISSSWVQNGGPTDLDPSMLVPWETYPDLPTKPSKS